jgi:predicted P-loop ATPase
MRFQKGTPWWLGDEAETGRLEASEPFREVDAWEEPIRRWTVGQAGAFTVAEVLHGALGKDTAYQERKDTMRVASILAHLGFEKRRVRHGEARAMHWSRPDAAST